MTEKVFFDVKAADVIFLRSFHGVTLRNKLRSCEIRKDRHVEFLLRTERSQLRWFGHVTRIAKVSPAGYRKRVQRSKKD